MRVGRILAGGGIGVYTYCTNDACDYFDKTQDAPEDFAPPAPPAATTTTKEPSDG